MRAAALGAVIGRVHRHHRLGDEIVELERLDEIGVPDQRAVGHLHVGGAGQHLVDQPHALRTGSRRCGTRRSCSASPSASGCAAPPSACRHWRCGTCRGGSSAVSAAFFGRSGWLALRLEDLGAAIRRGAAEHDQVDQRVGAEPVCAMHGDAGRLADRHQAGHDAVRVAFLLGQRLAAIVGGDAAHIVVHGRAAPGSAPWSRRRRQRSWRFRRCRAAAPPASWDRGDRGAGRCGPCSCRRRGPRGFRCVMARETTSREARSLADGA